jgi:hypothetical protein
LVTVIFCSRLAGSDVTAQHQSRVQIGYVVLYPHGSFSFLFNSIGFSYQHEKRKSASPSAIQVKNREKTIIIEKILSVIMQHEKGERIVDIHHNVTHGGFVHKIRDIPDN